MKIKYLKFFKIIRFNGGEGGIEPTNELPRCWFSRPVLNRSATSPVDKLHYLLLSK